MVAGKQPRPTPGERIGPENLTFVWGMESLPICDTPAHFFVVGGVGSGKTITLRLLMQSVLPYIGLGFDHRALVYDLMGTLAPALRGMGLRCPLHVLNPFDRGGVAWDIAADIHSPLAAQQIAAFLLPQDGSTPPFCADAARQLLAAVCLSFINSSPGRWTLRDVILATRNSKRLASLLSRAPETAAVLQSSLNDKRTRVTILQTLAAKLEPLAVVAACWDKANEKLSLEHWLHEEGVILLGYNPLFYRSVALINQAMMGLLAHLSFTQVQSAGRRTWIFLDEFSELGRIESLPVLMQQGRSKGVCVALSFRRLEEIHRLYGAEVADDLAAACIHKTALRIGDTQTAQWAERQFSFLFRADQLMSLPLAGPKNGFAGFHQTPRAGAHLTHKPWDWVLAHLPSREEAGLTDDLRPESDHDLQDWTDEDYRRLGFSEPSPGGTSTSG